MKLSVQNMINRFVASEGDSCEAAMLLVLTDEGVATTFCGVDSLMIGPEAVQFAIMMQHLLDNNLSHATHITERVKDGATGPLIKEVRRKTTLLSKDGSDADSDFEKFLAGLVKKMMEMED